ncbi:non-homologous end-joining DNA ligase [Pradoshia sp.]
MRYYAETFLRKFNRRAGLAEVAILKGQEVMTIAVVKERFSQEEKEALLKLLMEREVEEGEGGFEVPPGICIEISYSTVRDGKVLTPRFERLLLNHDWQACSWSNLILAQYESLELTNPNKELWPSHGITKERYMEYLLTVKDKMLPFMSGRLLTVKRYPEGVGASGFYQKSAPEHAPQFVRKVKDGDDIHIICENEETLLWLGNQAAIEFHIPFNTVDSVCPSDIVFDLDPPALGDLSLAVEAAEEMKKLFDRFKLQSFVKLSGRKGIQVHLPLNDGILTYEETRVFTEFIATYLVEQFPKQFTVERLKKKRGGRLYLDYIQHDIKKTIICPYSPRETEAPGIAVPLYWKEVQQGIKTDNFLMGEVQRRVEEGMNPFEEYFSIRQGVQIKELIAILNSR